MILNFRVKNFKSIKEMAEIDFVANSKQNDHKDSLIILGEEKILPVISIYGANASGKSNILKAIVSMVDTIMGEKNVQGLPYMVPFVFSEETKDSPTFFEIEIVDTYSKLVFRYGFECDKKQIYEEWLYQSNINDRDDETLVFYKNKKDDVFSISEMIDDSFKNEIEASNSIVRDYELTLGIMYKRRYDNDFKNANENFIKSAVLSALYGSLLDLSIVQLSYNIKESDFGMLNEAKGILENKKALASSTKMIQEIVEPTIIEIISKKTMDSDLNEINTLYTKRKDLNGKLHVMPFSMESSGTIKMLYLSIVLQMALDYGGQILFDELDIKLHPLIFRKVVKMFTNKETNKRGAQIIFSAHNIICLDSDDLRRDSIYFVEKNNYGTELYSLSDIKINGEVVRKDLDFGKNYLLGRFGGIPFNYSEG